MQEPRVVLIMLWLMLLNIENHKYSFDSSPQLSSVTSSLTEQILSHLFSQVDQQCLQNVSHLSTFAFEMYNIVINGVTFESKSGFPAGGAVIKHRSCAVSQRAHQQSLQYGQHRALLEDLQQVNMPTCTGTSRY